MGNKIHLFCCAMMGVMCYVCDVWISDWRYWAMVALVIIPYYCGKYDGENNKGDK